MSVVSIPELLRRGAQAPTSVSAVDAVMGEDWAHLDLGRGSAMRFPVDEGRRTGARRRAAIGGVLAPNPQALVYEKTAGRKSSVIGSSHCYNPLDEVAVAPERRRPGAKSKGADRKSGGEGAPSRGEGALQETPGCAPPG